MCPRRNNNNNNKLDNSKRQERENRQQEKKSREKKTHGKEDNDHKSLKNQLRTFNLELRNIIGDGNCLFRSFADQMDGDQHRHADYRKQIYDYMRTHREDFEPFIVDQSFDAFLRSISKDGTYGGNECIVAFSRLFNAKICIHQLNQPVWTVCFSESPKHEIHIFYHDYEHYSSVRTIGDHTSTSANIRQSMTTCDPSAINEKTKKPIKENSYGACAAIDSTEFFDEHDIDYILSQLTHPVDRQLIRDTLNDNHGDIDGTIASMLALYIPSTPQPITSQSSVEPIERIMTITGINDVELIRQSYMTNNLNIDSTVESLLKLTGKDGNIDGTIVSMLALDIPSTPQSSIEPIERIMTITGINDVELIQQSYMTNNLNIDSTVESLLKLTTNDDDDDDEKTSENEESKTKMTTKNRPVSSRQVKSEKKKAKKQRAMEKHRAEILAASGKKPPEKSDSTINNEQEQIPPANMEFIRI